MVLHSFSRTEMLIGTDGLKKLSQKKVAIFGIGGVGAFTAEGLVRSGVEKFVLIDDDDICLTNINRQIHAVRSTVGKPKVEVMKNRMLDINPKAEITALKILYNAESSDKLINVSYNYAVDAIDMVSSKLHLVEKCAEMNIPIISCMGAGNKLDPAKFEVADIFSTSVCPLARVMRKELRKRNIKKLKVVYSKENPMNPHEVDANCYTGCICPNKERTCTVRRHIPGSVSFVPSVAGLIIAGEVVKDLLAQD